MGESQAFPDETGPGAAGDAALVERLRARDLKAFEQLYHAYSGRLSWFARNLLRRPHLVGEVVNDTMMVVWNRIEAFDGRSRLSTWIFGIAYRQGLAALRKLDEPVEDETSDVAAHEELDPEQAARQERSRQALAEAIDRLSPAHRAVVNLTYFHEFSYREIAQIMECPVETVKTRMFHARRHLRQILSGELADWL